LVFLKFALILIFLEFAFDLLAEVRVGALVDINALFAGGREGGVLAHQGALVEEGAVAAHEGEVVDLLHGADLVSDGVAHVEQLAVVADVSIVPVAAVLAGEGLVQGFQEEVIRARWKLESHPGGGKAGNGHQDSEGDVHVHGWFVFC